MKENNPIIRKNTKHRVKKTFHFKKLWAIVVALTLVIGATVVPKLPIFGAFNPNEAITYAAYRQQHEIETGTLFIGTYLIHIGGLTDAYYEQAMESASESEQLDKYYYSELASGNWRNVSNSTSLEDLGPSSGAVATEEELGPLYITFVIDADGVKKNALTGEIVGAFDNPDPYDLYHLPELSALKNAYAGSETAEEPSLSEFMKLRGQTVSTSLLGNDSYEKGETSERSVTNDTFIYYAYNGFFQSNVKNEITDRCDTQLANLQNLYNGYIEASDDKRADAVFKLMEGVDALRRSEVFRQLIENENTSYLHVLGLQLNGQGYYGSDEFKTNTGETEGQSSAVDSCEEAYYNYLGKALKEGDDIMSNAIYYAGTAVLESNSNDDVDKLVSLYNVRDGQIVDKEKEVSVLDEDLLPEADDLYQTGLREGVSAEYMAEKRDKGAVSANSFLVEQRDSLESARSQLENFIDAKRKRLSSEEALEFILDRIEWGNDKYDTIQNDDFKENATESLDAHIGWLQSVAKEIMAENSSLGGTIADLNSQIAEETSNRDKALDENDYNAAEQSKVKIEELQKQLAEETASLTQIINSDNATDREKEKAKIALSGSGTTSGMGQALYDSALSALADGNVDSFTAAVEGLATLGETDKLNSLKDRLDNLSTDGSGDGTGDGSGDGSGDGTGDGSGDGSGDGTSDVGNAADASLGAISATAIAGLQNAVADAVEDSENAELGQDVTDATKKDNLEDGIKDVFGDSLDNLNGADLAGAIAGLAMLGDDGNTTAASMAASLARQHRSDLAYLYEQIVEDRTVDYVSLYTIGKVTDYRYIHYEERNVTTMFGNASSLSFKPDNKTVTNAAMQKRDLSGKTKKNGTLYVREEDATTYFSCEGQYVQDTTLAVCMTPSVKEKAETFYNTFKDLL